MKMTRRTPRAADFLLHTSPFLAHFPRMVKPSALVDTRVIVPISVREILDDQIAHKLA